MAKKIEALYLSANDLVFAIQFTCEHDRFFHEFLKHSTKDALDVLIRNGLIRGVMVPAEDEAKRLPVEEARRLAMKEEK